MNLNDSFGLYIGNSECMLSYVRNDTVSLLVSNDSRDYFPTIVTFESDTIYCCNKYLAKAHPDKTITNILYFLGKNIYDDEIQKESNTSVFPLVENADGDLCFFIENMEQEYWSIQNLISHLCTFFQKRLEETLNSHMKSCILAIPDNVSSKQQELLKRSVEESGIRVLKMVKVSICVGYYILNEIVYDEELTDWLNHYTMVFNFGEMESEISIIDFIDEKPHIINSVTSPAFCSDRIIRRVINHLETIVNQQYEVDLFSGLSGKLWQKEFSRIYNDISEQLLFFSQTDSISIELPLSCQRWIKKNAQVHVEDIEISRNDVQRIIKDLLDGVVKSINLCLMKCEIHCEDLYRVLPIGKYSYLVFFQDMLMKLFGEKRVYRRHGSSSCIAYGLGEILK